MVKELISLFYVPQCHGCERRLADGERYLCGKCRAELPLTYYETQPMNLMVQRFAGQVSFERATALCFYNRGTIVSHIFHDFKYRGYSHLAEYMGELSAEKLRDSGFFDGIDALVPIPIHILKRIKRGYNQSELICRGLSKVLNIPVMTGLRAVRRHKTQTSMTLDERKKNVEGVFRFTPGEDPTGKHLLIVDDVCTTGTTIFEAAKVIKTAYPGVKLSFFTVGVTY
jgi:ComF family protein